VLFTLSCVYIQESAHQNDLWCMDSGSVRSETDVQLNVIGSNDSVQQSELKGLWTFGILSARKQSISEKGLSPSSGKGSETPILRCSSDSLALSKGPNRVCAPFPSPEDGDRSSFRNALLSSA
jgi:hypothetical protein